MSRICMGLSMVFSSSSLGEVEFASVRLGLSYILRGD